MLDFLVNPYVLIGLCGLGILLLILNIVALVKISGLKARYQDFMEGQDGKSLEDSFAYRMDQVDELVEANAANERNIQALTKKMSVTFQKYGLVKYNALEQMGGKLSFTLAMLSNENDGFILNVVHSREGCYSYIKEIIDGHAISSLAKEEEQALKRAMGEDVEEE